ncbi:hypothetical protein ACN4EG_20440 [Alkalinema pantanalense CENA528]|uniref:hypothetical protein n=1 Tax=Alkalinema pantanalense TaxID=1620705 RepID=UPI003D6F765A
MAASRTKALVRLPDFTVLSEEGEIALKDASRSIVFMDVPPPLLVVEVVCEG